MKTSLMTVTLFITICLISTTSCWANAKGKLDKYFIFGSPSGGSSYTHGAVVSELLNRNLKPKLKSSIETVPNPMLIMKYIVTGEIHAVAFSTAAAYDAYNGNRPFGSKHRLRNLVSGSFPAATVMSFVVRSDSGIKTVGDLKGKSIYGDDVKGPIAGRISKAILNANGLDMSDVKWLKYSALYEGYRDVKEGRVDAIFSVLGSASQDMGETVGAHMISLNKAEQNAGSRAVPAYIPVKIPKGFKGTDDQANLLGSVMCYWVSHELSEKTAYTVIKTIFENLDEYHGAIPEAVGFSKKNALSAWIIPYHPGAVIYFKEIGIWGPEEEKKQRELLKAEKNMF